VLAENVGCRDSYDVNAPKQTGNTWTLKLPVGIVGNELLKKEYPMEFPEIITRLPEAAIPFPSSVVKTSVLQSENGQLVFFDVIQAVDLPPHSHKAQWGMVVHGQRELTISDETRIYGPGIPYFIPSGVVHSARIPAGTKIIEFFEEKDRYKLK